MDPQSCTLLAGDFHRGAGLSSSSPKRLASHGIAAALLRFRQHRLVTAFEALRWNRIASSSSSERLPSRSCSSKAAPSVQRCKRKADELRRQLTLCKEAFRSSNQAAERLLFGKRQLARLQIPPIEYKASENGGEFSYGGASGSRGFPSEAGTRPANDDHLELAAVWHPPGKEDEANWKELTLLVEGLREENPKWAACLLRVVQKLEASHIACRKQRDSLLEAAQHKDIPVKTNHEDSRSSTKELEVGQLNSFPVHAHHKVNHNYSNEAEEAELMSYSLATDFKSDEIIFAGYGRLSPVKVSAANESVNRTPPALESEDLHEYPTSDNGMTEELAAQADLPEIVDAPELSPKRLLSKSPSSGQTNAVVGATVGPPTGGPPQRVPLRVPHTPLIPSVQISLLAERGGLGETGSANFGRQAATDISSSSTETSSEDSCDETSGHDRGVWPSRVPPSNLLTDPSCPLAPEQPPPALLERPCSNIDQMAPPPDRTPVDGRLPEPPFLSDSMKLAENIRLSSKVQEILGARLPHTSSQNGLEGVGSTATVGSGSAPTVSVHGSSGSLSVGLGTNSGVVWPLTTLYTPRANVGDRQDGLLDNLSRSSTSLLSNPYTPRHKTANRLGGAPLRNQASRTGSLRYPPSNLSRPFAVQRMPSGTLAQPSTPQPSGAAPSPRPMTTGVGNVINSVPKRSTSTRTPSVSASPARTDGRGYHGHNQQPNQAFGRDPQLKMERMSEWPGMVRPASVVAPAAVHPSTSSVTRGSLNGVSRQSSVERTPSVVRHPPASGSFGSSSSTAWMSAETYNTYMGNTCGVPDPVRRAASFQSSGGSLAGSCTGPIGSGNSAPSAPRTAPAVPKLPTNGLACFNTKSAPPPQTSVPTNAKGYSSIQLWTPRSQAQAGSDVKQVPLTREAREISVEPPQVGRSPSASLPLSPRKYPGVSIPNTGGQTALLSKLSAWRA